jgi:hypothetical protein
MAEITDQELTIFEDSDYVELRQIKNQTQYVSKMRKCTGSFVCAFAIISFLVFAGVMFIPQPVPSTQQFVTFYVTSCPESDYPMAQNYCYVFHQDFYPSEYVLKWPSCAHFLTDLNCLGNVENGCYLATGNSCESLNFVSNIEVALYQPALIWAIFVLVSLSILALNFFSYLICFYCLTVEVVKSDPPTQMRTPLASQSEAENDDKYEAENDDQV